MVSAGWEKKCPRYQKFGAVLSRPPGTGRSQAFSDGTSEKQLLRTHSDTALYLHRFSVDHWYRFLKQRLHWTVPKLSTPKQCERWSDLMPMMTWELWFQSDLVADNPLPWQNSIDKLTPGRVAQAMHLILEAIGTPAHSPKTRGKSPGWEPGKSRQRRIRYPIVKKTTTKPRKQQKKSA